MKLDPRIENESLIYTPFSKAKINLHEKGYFADDMMSFSDLKECVYGELVDIDTNEDYPYMCKSDTIWHGFYIPESSLKSVEENNKLKPFTIEKFCREFKLGEINTYRKMDTKHTYLNMFVGYDYADEKSDNPSLDSIHLGACSFSLQELFDNYEYQYMYSEIWKPFGVKE